MDTSVQILPAGGYSYRLRLDGRLPPLWAGDLASGLAAQEISILSGRGRGAGLNWKAELLLDFTAAQVVPERVDYLKLAASSSGAAFAGKVRLSHFACNRLPNGLLEVWVYGPDQPGFLARVLGRMAVSLLFLAEFDIETRSGRIEDRFVLIGMGGIAPSEEVQKALERNLRSLCEARE